MRNLVYIFLTFFCLGSCFGADVSATHTPLVLAFEARAGEFVSHGPGYSLSVTSQGADLNLSGHALRMRLAGADGLATLEALDRMPGRTNYILGRDLPRSYALYGRVRSRGVYRGIDVLFRGNQERLEYDFEIAAGLDPSRIKVDFQGADEIRIDPRGALILRAGALEMRQPKPVAYQIIDGKQSPVEVGYQLDASNQVRFHLGPYDHSQPLVIDPVLDFDNAFGGSGFSSAADVVLDSQGNIYVAGQTNSANFPVMNAEQNHPGASRLQVSADGGQTWTAPLGIGAVTWMTSAPSAPSTLYAATSAGVIKSADGGSTWTTPANAGLTALPVAVAVDAASANTVYAASPGQGVFTSTNGGASWNLSTSGLIVSGTTPPAAGQFFALYASPAQTGTVFAIAQFPAVVYRSTDAGQTWTQVNIPTGGFPEALVFSPTNAKTLFLAQRSGPLLTSADGGSTWTSLANENVMNPQGLAILPGNPPILLAAGGNALGRSTDGGNTWTSVLALNSGTLAVDPRNAGVAYALSSTGVFRTADSGQTWAQLPLPLLVAPDILFVYPANSQVFAGGSTQSDAFITKWSADGSQILYSTYLGGSGTDFATGIAVDSSGSPYVAGYTASTDFPVTRNAFQTTLTGQTSSNPQVAFVSKLSPDGSQLVYSTFLGANAPGPQYGGAISGIAVDSAGEAVISGTTFSANFPVTPGAFQSVPESCNIEDPFVQLSGAAFVTKMAADGGSLVFSTLLGGRCSTWAQTVALDPSGNTWVAGFTDSTDFPVTKDALQSTLGGGSYDGFLARFNPGGALSYATYIGGAGYDTITGLAFDPKGNIYLTGTTGGLSQPSSPGAVQSAVTVSCVIFSIGPGVYQATGSAFVLKLDPAAHTALGLTYLGSPLCLYPSDIAIDAAGEPWIAGPLSFYGSAPQTASPFQIGIGNGFVSKFSADFTQLLFSTYFDSVSGIALDSAGLAYVAGVGPIAQDVGSGTIPISLLNSTNATGQAYVAKIDPTPPAISLDSIQNAVNPASPNNSQGIGPGEVLRLLGKNMGPAATTMGIVNGGILATSVAGVEVTFDGVAMPLLSVSANEIDMMGPFELAGKSAATVQVQYNGVKSNAVRVSVGLTQPLSVNLGGPVQILGVYNPGFTPNSASNPAQAGSVMTMYVAGFGQTVPPSRDGQVNGLPLTALPANVLIQYSVENPNNITTLPITYAGTAPGLAAGIFQINFIAPQQSQPSISMVVGNSIYAASGNPSFSVTVR